MVAQGGRSDGLLVAGMMNDVKTRAYLHKRDVSYVQDGWKHCKHPVWGGNDIMQWAQPSQLVAFHKCVRSCSQLHYEAINFLNTKHVRTSFVVHHWIGAWRVIVSDGGTPQPHSPEQGRNPAIIVKYTYNLHSFHHFRLAFLRWELNHII